MLLLERSGIRAAEADADDVGGSADPVSPRFFLRPKSPLDVELVSSSTCPEGAEPCGVVCGSFFEKRPLNLSTLDSEAAFFLSGDDALTSCNLSGPDGTRVVALAGVKGERSGFGDAPGPREVGCRLVLLLWDEMPRPGPAGVEGREEVFAELVKVLLDLRRFSFGTSSGTLEPKGPLVEPLGVR